MDIISLKICIINTINNPKHSTINCTASREADCRATHRATREVFAELRAELRGNWFAEPQRLPPI